MVQNETEIAENSLKLAIDQVEAYESLTKSFEAYSINACDTANEKGLDASETSCIFEKLARDAGYAKEVDAMWRI
jgi:hypothetical protein